MTIKKEKRNGELILMFAFDEILLLLLGGGNLLSGLGDLSKHDNTVTLHDSDTGKTLAVLEGVNNKWLLWGEHDLSHLVSLQAVGFLSLLSSGLFTHLPYQLGHSHSGSSGTHEAYWSVSNLQLTRVVKDLNLGSEGSGLLQGSVLLVHHHVSGTRHVILVKSLDVKTNVVSGLGLVSTLVVHFTGENLSSARVGGSVGWKEENFLTRLDNSLLNTSSDDITNSLNLYLYLYLYFFGILLFLLFNNVTLETDSNS